MKSTSYTTFVKTCKEHISNFLHEEKWQPGNIILAKNMREKAPGDWVTNFDIKISQIIQQTIEEQKLPHLFISEETWPKGKMPNFTAPLIILDPIDGTNGFKNGSREISLSLSIMEDGYCAFSWIWNFATDEEHISTSLKPEIWPADLQKLGLVSSTEWKAGLWQKNEKICQQQNIQIKPCGSIAYKLLLLSTGKCAFVASKRPKKLWDIAAGTHLVQAKGFKLFCQSTDVLKLNQMVWNAPLLWCKPNDATTLNTHLFGH